MANLTVAMISSIAIALLLSTTLQAQDHMREAAGGNGAREYVLLEPRPEQLVRTLPEGETVTAANSTGPVCGPCSCCLANTNPNVCLSTCCFVESCSGRVCMSRSVSCGCNFCAY